MMAIHWLERGVTTANHSVVHFLSDYHWLELKMLA